MQRPLPVSHPKDKFNSTFFTCNCHIILKIGKKPLVKHFKNVLHKKKLINKITSLFVQIASLFFSLLKVAHHLVPSLGHLQRNWKQFWRAQSQYLNSTCDKNKKNYITCKVRLLNNLYIKMSNNGGFSFKIVKRHTKDITPIQNK